MKFWLNFQSIMTQSKFHPTFTGRKLIENFDWNLSIFCVCIESVVSPFNLKWLKCFILIQSWLNSEINQKFLCVFPDYLQLPLWWSLVKQNIQHMQNSSIFEIMKKFTSWFDFDWLPLYIVLCFNFNGIKFQSCHTNKNAGEADKLECMQFYAKMMWSGKSTNSMHSASLWWTSSSAKYSWL